MGTMLSYLRGYASDDTVDPCTGLTARQRRLVKDTWKLISADSVGAGVTIMTSYFKKYPHYQQVFLPFKDVPLEELPGNKKFQAHCLNIVGTLNNALDALEDASLMEAVMLTTGERHGRRGQGRQEFIDLKGVLMNVLENALGSRFTPEMSDAWDKTIDVLFSLIFQGMDNVNSSK